MLSGKSNREHKHAHHEEDHVDLVVFLHCKFIFFCPLSCFSQKVRSDICFTTQWCKTDIQKGREGSKRFTVTMCVWSNFKILAKLNSLCCVTKPVAEENESHGIVWYALKKTTTDRTALDCITNLIVRTDCTEQGCCLRDFSHGSLKSHFEAMCGFSYCHLDSVLLCLPHSLSNKRQRGWAWVEHGFWKLSRKQVCSSLRIDSSLDI